jgi:hypothetical protein
VSSQRSTRANNNQIRQQKLESLKGWTWSPRDDKWELGFTKLLRFVEINTHSRVPDECVIDGYNLGNWISKTRHGWLKLSKDQQLRLSALPKWTIDARDSKWMDMLELVRQFNNDQGASRIPYNFVYMEQPIGSWVGMQRNAKKNGVLSDDRIVLLETIPKWSWDPHEEDWLEGYSQLELFVKSFNHCNVPSKPKYVSPDGYPLGSWVQKQKFKKSELSFERIKRLESLKGWSWNSRHEKWNAGFEKLSLFVQSNGHCDVNKDMVCEDGFELGKWVKQQRWQWTDLSEELRSRLLTLTGWSKIVADKLP